MELLTIVVGDADPWKSCVLDSGAIIGGWVDRNHVSLLTFRSLDLTDLNTMYRLRGKALIVFERHLLAVRNMNIERMHVHSVHDATLKAQRCFDPNP